MTLRALLLAALAPALILAAPAHAQDERRLDQIDRQVRELRSIVFQGRDTGQPVIVKPAGPDPDVTALQQRVGDLEQTLQRVNGQLDTATHDLDQSRKANADDRAAAAQQIKDLTDRVNRLESQGAGAAPAGPAPGPSAQAGSDGGVAPEDVAPPPRRVHRGADATARAQAADRGVLGGATDSGNSGGSGAAAPAAPARGTEADSYRAAKSLLASGDYPGASQGFQDYLSRFPTGAHTREAQYWLGESLFIQDSYADAARAYARALSGWPKTGWAPEATVKLSQSLLQVNLGPKACQALGEFDRRYGATASPASKARADTVRAKAKCAG